MPLLNRWATTAQKGHSLEPVENDTVPQKAQCTHCLRAAGRQVQKCHNTNKLSPGDICCSHASKINSSLKVLHRKWCWGANSQHFTTQSIPSGSTKKSREKVTDFELTLPNTNKKSMLCLWTGASLCLRTERPQSSKLWIFDHILDFVRILRVEEDVRNTFFAQQLFLLGIKLNFPASKERLSVSVCVLQIYMTTLSYQWYFTDSKERFLHKCFKK